MSAPIITVTIVLDRPDHPHAPYGYEVAMPSGTVLAGRGPTPAQCAERAAYRLVGADREMQP